MVGIERRQVVLPDGMKERDCRQGSETHGSPRKDNELATCK
jgi:hypothetical protein